MNLLVLIAFLGDYDLHPFDVYIYTPFIAITCYPFVYVSIQYVIVPWPFKVKASVLLRPRNLLHSDDFLTFYAAILAKR